MRKIAMPAVILFFYLNTTVNHMTTPVQESIIIITTVCHSVTTKILTYAILATDELEIDVSISVTSLSY